MSLENDIIKVRYKANSPELKGVKGLAIFFTVLYSLALPFVLIGLFYSTLIVIVTMKEAPVQLFFNIILPLLIPISLITSIGKMWSNYYKQNIGKILFYAGLPFLTLIFFMLITYIIGHFFK